MSRGRKKWRQKRPRDERDKEAGNAEKRQKRDGDYRSNKGWSTSGKPEQNPVFNEFYQMQKVVPEHEWEQFITTLQVPLPTTFRINSAGEFAPMLQERMKKQFIEKLQEVTVDDCKNKSRKDRKKLIESMAAEAGEAMDAEDSTSDAAAATSAAPATDAGKPTEAEAEAASEGDEEGEGDAANAGPTEKYDPPSVLPWYPSENGWHFTASRALLRRDINLYGFHRFLISQSESGGITRQEAVSMIPPLLLDIQPHHKVLDMCAAPGSKTSQILEYMQRDWKNGQDYPSGFVIANDAAESRCYMLFHQIAKLGTPNCLVTNHEAQAFPTLRDAKTGEPCRFDRILADVPCSGDGTLRKNLDLWRRWKPMLGIALHRLQIEIAIRAIQLLKVGARMVYSTCSFNPMEDEAVVAQVLRYFQGNVEVLDVSNELPELQRRPGLTTWKVQGNDNQWYESPSDLQKETKHLCKSMFPPTEEESKWMNLDRCLRMLPHLQNTGGFFVAVLQRTHNVNVHEESASATSSTSSSTPAVAQESDPAPAVEQVAESTESSADAMDSTEAAPDAEQKPSGNVPAKDEGEKKKKRKNPQWAPDAPFIFISEREQWKSILDELRDFYGIQDTFPMDTLFVRSEDTPAKIYMMNPELLKLFKNDREHKKMRVVNTGVRIFARERSCASSTYRITSEGVRVLNPHMTKRIISAPEKDILPLIEEDVVPAEKLSAGLVEAVSKLEPGSFVLRIDLSRLNLGIVAFVAWRGSGDKVHLLIPKEKRASMHMLFLDESTLYKPEEEASTSAQ